MTINCNGNLVDLSTPKVMGILNVTPDSFYDGGQYKNDSEIKAQVDKMLTDGATFIDLGAYSSRPGAQHISEEEECLRIVPIVKFLVSSFPNILLSIDTFRSRVAHECLQEGAALINDISGGALDPKMLATVGAHKVPYILMHTRGNPRNMAQQTDYQDLLGEILYYFSEKILLARQAGINDIIIDPGFGFAKTLEQNYEIFQKMELLHQLELPILTGISRKSMIYKLLNTSPSEALNGSTALNMYALSKKTNLLRVHDVKEAVECITLYNAINTNRQRPQETSLNRSIIMGAKRD
ncbi:Dihydropteroate synthase [Arenibacter antarcticus]|uniref:Dihydropteroate synthase n=1 Tax=Arenibacter antarcticus TaxID=2040469 RepID=A0ABW5VD00_9FLAO|nr:dihydropteroate synthase [Arenibacter sp. H213]MCM4169556.1 dihydropteroate synthase [Arenibacter sp. H213]